MKKLISEGNYKKAIAQERSSMKDVKEYARLILLQQGIDISIVDTRTEGIPIPFFNEFVKKVYDLGYQDGEEQYMNAKKLKKDIEVKGFSLKKHIKKAMIMANMEKY